MKGGENESLINGAIELKCEGKSSPICAQHNQFLNLSKDIKKLGFFERLIVGKRKVVVLPEGPAAYVVIFKDGEKYMVEGDRNEGKNFVCYRETIRRISGDLSIPPQRTNECLIEIIREELGKRRVTFELK